MDIPKKCNCPCDAMCAMEIQDETRRFIKRQIRRHGASREWVIARMREEF